ncbi:MAG: FecR family protein, partial [Candidatus Marinimicrobia bacterium]|nr:FecR family protein [Candidatus Neomarinimicrobiota bacterium]
MPFIKKISIIFILFTITICSGETIGRVMKVSGEVLIKPIGSGTYSVSVKLGQAISNGDAIRVGEASFAVVIFLDDKSVVKIKENTDFQFVETSNTRSLIIEQGTTLHNVNSKDRKKDYRVETPVSVASVKGTEFSAFHDAVAGVDKFVGKSGNFDVFNSISGMTVNVGAGQKAVSNAMGQLIPAPAEPGDYPEDPEGDSPEEQQEEQDQPEEQDDTQEQQDRQTQDEQPQREEPTSETEMETEQPSEPSDAQADQQSTGDKPKPKAKKPVNLGLGVGSATIDGTIYNQVALRPELSFGKLGIGLDLVMYIDNQGNIREDEWDEASDIIDKFLFIRWGQKSDPFWFKWGSLNNVTIGYGGLLAGYSNMMEFPSVRKVGINTGMSFGSFGGELFLSNMKDFSRGGTLMGLRGTYKLSDAIPLTFGLNFIMDMNQFSGLKDVDEDTYPDIFDDFPTDKDYWNDTDGDGIADVNGGTKEPENGWDIDGDGDNILDSADNDLTLKPTPFSLKDNKATAQGFAFDLGYPILKGKSLSLEAYMEYNKLIFPAVAGDAYYSRKAMGGTGITVPGIRASLFSFLNVSFEYRIKQGFFA